MTEQIIQLFLSLFSFLWKALGQYFPLYSVGEDQVKYLEHWLLCLLLLQDWHAVRVEHSAAISVSLLSE